MAERPLDSWLQERMRAVGLFSWRALQARAGISRRALNQVRQGKWGSLRLEQLQKLAAALQWDLGFLLRLNGHDKMGSTEPPEVLFSLLQPLLTSYPTVREIARRKPDWPAQNVTALFRSLDALLQHWGYEPIGSPLESVPFDPQLTSQISRIFGQGIPSTSALLAIAGGTISSALPKSAALCPED